MNNIPKVTVTRDQNAEGWLASCGRIGCGFLFWHRLRHVVDEAAVAHQRADMRKAVP